MWRIAHIEIIDATVICETLPKLNGKLSNTPK
jgi:hypothetical protein